MGRPKSKWRLVKFQPQTYVQFYGIDGDNQEFMIDEPVDARSIDEARSLLEMHEQYVLPSGGRFFHFRFYDKWEGSDVRLGGASSDVETARQADPSGYHCLAPDGVRQDLEESREWYENPFAVKFLENASYRVEWLPVDKQDGYVQIFRPGFDVLLRR